MTMLTSSFAIAAIGALAVWTFGGLGLRTLGTLTVIAGPLITATGNPAGLLVTVAGLVVWLAGHYLYAARRHTYRSLLARRICTHPRLTRLDVTRGWTTPITSPHARTEQHIHRGGHTRRRRTPRR